MGLVLPPARYRFVKNIPDNIEVDWTKMVDEIYKEMHD